MINRITNHDAVLHCVVQAQAACEQQAAPQQQLMHQRAVLEEQVGKLSAALAETASDNDTQYIPPPLHHACSKMR